MKRSKICSTLALGSLLVAFTTSAPTAKAATPAQITTAIQNGLAALYLEIQTSGCPVTNTGCWTSDDYYTAPTGSAVFAFLSAKSYWPAAQVANYNTAVANGIAFLLANASTVSVSLRDDNANICPSGSGTCTGVYWYGEGEATYSTGLTVGAIDTYGLSIGSGAVATTSGPLAGMTWGAIAQGITNAFAASQSTTVDQANYGEYGGWRYSIPGNGDSDTSTTQWAVYSFIFDSSLGATTPASTKTLLANYLNVVQEPSGSAAAGGACYQSVINNGCPIGPDNSDTGGWLLGQQFLGTPASNAAVQSALGWMNTNWTTSANATWYGDFNQPYAMLASYKGLETTLGTTSTASITNLLTPTCGGNLPAGTACNWYQDYQQWLVANQAGNGSWAGSGYWTDPLSTAFDIVILGTASIPVGPVTPTTPIVSTLGLAVLGLALLAVWRYRAGRTASNVA